MSLNHHWDQDNYSNEPFKQEKPEDIAHLKKVKKMLEEQLERKRLKAEIDELDGEFNWDNF